MVGHPRQELALTALVNDLIHLLCHLLVLSEKVRVEIAWIVHDMTLRLAVRTKHLTVFFIEESNGRVEHHQRKEIILFLFILILLASMLRNSTAAMAERRLRAAVDLLIIIVRTNF